MNIFNIYKTQVHIFILYHCFFLYFKTQSNTSHSRLIYHFTKEFIEMPMEKMKGEKNGS